MHFEVRRVERGIEVSTKQIEKQGDPFPHHHHILLVYPYIFLCVGRVQLGYISLKIDFTISRGDVPKDPRPFTDRRKKRRWEPWIESNLRLKVFVL